ncbi:MAG: dephospho-CoA kinase [Clostridia bacterium]|nr:dephospho-CoA kinase [Clostridia bacterium]
MIYGLTGGIGSGKSTVSNILRDKGFTVLDADEIGREVTAKGQPLLRMLVNEFGIEIIQEDGTLNRRLLADMVFGDRAKTRRLNEMVQTAILVKAIERAHKLQLTDTKKVIFFDVPLLFEAGWDRYVKEVWLVTAPEDVRIERVEVRDGLTEAEIRKRIRLQMSEEEKMERSDVIIENDEGMAKLMMQVDKAIAERL